MALLAGLGWACVAPLREASREKMLDLGATVPAAVRLTLGVQDVLVLHNTSAVAQVFGPVRVLPGHVLRLPFEQAGEFAHACQCGGRGQMLLRIVAPPDPGLARLRWRFMGLVDAVRDRPPVAPVRS